MAGPGPLVVALDTATRLEALAVVRGDRVLSVTARRGERGASAVLLPELERAMSALGLEIGDIDAVAVCRGPGSFTGLRVGLATALGLADAVPCPLFGFTSLEARAASLPYARWPVCVVLDARKGEVYGGLFDVSHGLPRPLLDEAVEAPDAWFGRVARAVADPVLVVGDGVVPFASVMAEHLGDRGRASVLVGERPAVEVMASVAARRLSAGEEPSAGEGRPLYLRPPDAERASPHA